jgi:hypothetical protein
MDAGVFSVGKRPGLGFNHSPPLSADVKERIDKYFYSSTVPLWQIIGWILTFVLLLGALLREVKWSGREANHPFPNSAEVKKWSYTSIITFLNGTHSGGVWGVERKDTACNPASEV